MTVLMTNPLAAAEMKGNQKVNLWGEAPTPHFKASGKPVSAARGAQVYEDHCALCHGLEGKGDGPRSAFFQSGQQYIADLSNADFVNGRDAQLLHSIREGLQRFPEPSYVMPQFKYILSDEEIRSALAYIKTLPRKSKR
jgi:mono/diheme cytochrome c family protein